MGPEVIQEKIMAGMGLDWLPLRSTRRLATSLILPLSCAALAALHSEAIKQQIPYAAVTFTALSSWRDLNSFFRVRSFQVMLQQITAEVPVAEYSMSDKLVQTLKEKTLTELRSEMASMQCRA
jgi:hypothetical protein